MKQLNLTTLQRKTIMTDLKKGKSVPLSLLCATKRSHIRCASIQPKYFAKRVEKRKRETMVSSGAFDMPQFVPQAKVDREKEKERLQNICFGINEILDEEESVQNQNNETLEIKSSFAHERIKELLQEIEDQIQFLKETEKLGFKQKYESVIKNEISQKMNQIEKLSKSLPEMKQYQNSQLEC